MIPKHIKVGSRVEIRILQEVRNEAMPMADKVMYTSAIADMSEYEDIIYIYQPSDKTRKLNLQKEIRYDLIFVSDSNNLYRTVGELVGFAKENDRQEIIYHKIKITAPIEKHQRREFFREHCNIPVVFYEIPKEIALLPTMQEVENQAILDAQQGVHGSLSGTILDISGGGIRFTSNKLMERGMFGIFEFEMKNDKVDQQVRIVGQLLDSGIPEGAIGVYHNRVSFSFKSNADREKVVQFVFTEQMRKRSTK